MDDFISINCKIISHIKMNVADCNLVAPVASEEPRVKPVKLNQAR